MIELVRRSSSGPKMVGSLTIGLMARLAREIDRMMAVGSISNARSATRAAEIRREMIAALMNINGSLGRTA